MKIDFTKYHTIVPVYRRKGAGIKHLRNAQKSSDFKGDFPLS